MVKGILVLLSSMLGFAILVLAALGLAWYMNGMPPVVKFVGNVSHRQDGILACYYSPSQSTMECMTFKDFAAKATELDGEHSL